MRRAFAAAVLAATVALVTGGVAAPANAVCGGGQPGEPCQCEFPVLSKFIPITC